MDKTFFLNIINIEKKENNEKIFLKNTNKFINIDKTLKSINKEIYNDKKKLTIYNTTGNLFYVIKVTDIHGDLDSHQYNLDIENRYILSSSMTVNSLLIDWILSNYIKKGYYIGVIFTKSCFIYSNKLYSIQEKFSFNLLKYIKGVKNYKFNILAITSITFQIIYSIYTLQKKFLFVHNDLGCNNIGLKSLNSFDIFNKTFKIGDRNYNLNIHKFNVRIFDFEFSQCKLNNIKIMPEVYKKDMYKATHGISEYFNPYYDIYTFLYNLKKKILKYHNIKIKKISFFKNLFECYNITKKNKKEIFMKNGRPKTVSNPLIKDPKFDYIKQHETALLLMINDKNMKTYINL